MNWNEGRCVLLVNDHRHSSLAMLSLGAVQPHGRGAVDHDGVGGCQSCCGCYGHESRKDTSHIGGQADGRAWRGERRLGDCVVCWGELELDHLSHGCHYVVWRECQSSIC